MDSYFTNVETQNVVGLKPGYDYSELDAHGLIKENTYMDDKKVLIGKVVADLDGKDTVTDASSFPKKGQTGYVDRTFITEGETGFRIAKVRVRSERIPAIGDKFCSRCGQKGTVGLVIPEADMPFTENGLRPDIIINPHALPSRMTIGQLIETLMGKACGIYGAFGDCTAFVNKGSKHKIFGEMLTQVGFHSSGTEVLYNGNTGEQLESNIYIGPTYYMRLKHMVKDKINYRALGPRTVLTRQTVQGRANDGGLRIGEMDRDALIAHGITNFIQESMLVRGDDYYMAVCNKTGTIAIYNESYNLFLSPFADGPIKFNGTLAEDLNIINISRFGRSFSIVRVPYALKLLIQELQAMNIQLRIITEENINQLTNMSFSDNIEKLLGRSVTIKELNAMNYNNMGSSMAGVISSSSSSGKDKVGKKTDANIAFNKLTQPLFLKWLIPKTEINDIYESLINVSVMDGENNGPDVVAEKPWLEMRDKLNAAKKLLDPIPEEAYIKINQTLDLYRNLRNTMSKKYYMFDATNASLKMYELLMQMNLVDCASLANNENTLNSFSNAELPGAFIIAIKYYIESKCAGKQFNWLASSYLPMAAAAVGNKTILEDKFKLYEMNRDRWLMGPKPNGLPTSLPDITGDVTDPETVLVLGRAVRSRFATTEGAKLYTSDAGIDVTGDYAGQEENTSAINYGQVLSGLLSLARGGNFVTKQYTFFTPFSRSLIALVAGFFEETYIVKPATSRPGNSEVYLVGKNFKGIDPLMETALLERSELFKTLGVNPTTLGPLVIPEIMAQVDPVLYKISEEFFMDIQIKFINEYVDVFKNYGGYMDVLADNVKKNVTEAETNWLAENKVVPIKPEQSLTWYRHNKQGGGGNQDSGSNQNSADEGINISGIEDNNDNDANNYPIDDTTAANNTPVGYVKFSSDNQFDEEQEANWQKIAPIGGAKDAVEEPEPSLLEFKEIDIETEKLEDGSENNNGENNKKTVKIDMK